MRWNQETVQHHTENKQTEAEMISLYFTQLQQQTSFWHKWLQENPGEENIHLGGDPKGLVREKKQQLLNSQKHK